MRRKTHVPHRGTTLAFPQAVQTGLLPPPSRYTAQCVHCGRVVFRDARRMDDLQVRMIESHMLLCRPLAVVDEVDDLLGHFRIIESAA